MIKKLNYFISVFLILTLTVSGQERISTLSWNIANLGQSKSDSVLNFIAHTVQNFDIVAIQEVVAGRGGAQAIAQLVDQLNRLGSKWDYRISDPTTSENVNQRERYAYLWKPSKIQLVGKPWLDKNFQEEIVREPYLATFQKGKTQFTLVNFHAVPKKRQPETEIKYFKFFPQKYPTLTLIFCGDFNLPQSHNVFHPLKQMGFTPLFRGQKTTLKMKCLNGDCLASEYDNFFYPGRRIQVHRSGILAFYLSFTDVKIARKVSDHIPIWMEFSMN